MATITKIQRSRVVLDLLKDGEVAALANYANVEMLDGPTALKYARAFWDAYPHPDLFEQDGTTPREPTNEELATFYINRLRKYHADVLASVRVKTAAETAAETERAAVKGEAATDLSGHEGAGLPDTIITVERRTR